MKRFLHKTVFLSLFLTCIRATSLGAEEQSEAIIEAATDGVNTHQIKWQGIAGRLYTIQISTDLKNWGSVPVLELGEDESIIWGFTPVGRKFVRLKYSVSTGYSLGYGGDADGDGLSNGDEVCLYGSDPFDSDSDGDTLPDYDEVKAGLSPVLVNSDGIGPNDVNEDSDGDGIVNSVEISNSSFIFHWDSDGDLLPDGDDWAEMVDTESHRQSLDTYYNPGSPMLTYPDASARASFRAANKGAVPGFNGDYYASRTNEGSLIVAKNSYELQDLDMWWQEAIATKSVYRLRTGHAAAGSVSSPAANSQAQNVTVPVLIHRLNSVGPTGLVIEENFEMQYLPIVQGVVTITTDIPPEPQDLADYTDGLGRIYLYQVVTATPNAIRLAVDTNMNGEIESLRDGVHQGPNAASNDNADNGVDFITGATAPSGQIPLLKSGDAGMILDINNNNSDGVSPASAFKEIHDHLSVKLDAFPDESELTINSNKPGHLSGTAEICVAFPLPGGINGSTTSHRKFNLFLRRSGPACTRVHLVGGTVLVPFFDRCLLGISGDYGSNNVPDTREEQLIYADWFNNVSAAQGMKRLPIIIEGVRTGKEDLFLELRDTLSDAVVAAERVRIQVNIDQTPDPNLGLTKGNPLAGANPHYFGVSQVPSGLNGSSTIEAIRGRFTAEVPAGFDVTTEKWLPHMSWKNGKLRNGEMNPSKPATASFWLGLNTVNPTAAPSTGEVSHMWVQFGLLLSQEPGDSWPNQSEGNELKMYLETGRRGGYLQGHSPVYKKASETDGVFDNWQTLGIDLDFVLFQDRDGQVTTDPDWHLVCKDKRSGAGGYFHIKRGRPTVGGIVNPVVQTNLDEIAHFSLYQQVEIETELSNSVSFLFGHGGRTTPSVPARPGSFANLQYATSRTNPSFPNFTSNTGLAKKYFDWAMDLDADSAHYNWTPLILGNSGLTSSFTTGMLNSQNQVIRNSQSGATTTANGGFWQMLLPNSSTFQVQDTRMWGFAGPRRQ